MKDCTVDFSSTFLTLTLFLARFLKVKVAFFPYYFLIEITNTITNIKKYLKCLVKYFAVFNLYVYTKTTTTTTTTT